MKQIQECLGPANFNTTADVYSHLDFDSKIESANKISQTLSFKEENGHRNVVFFSYFFIGKIGRQS